MTVAPGFLLDGRVRHDQPAAGFRSGIEPVLLAASIPARPGERVLEGGAAAGAALLCLAARVPGVVGVGVERDSALVALAAANARANRFGLLSFVAASIPDLPFGGGFDHAFANPPYHRADGTRSPVAAREAAKRADAATLDVWARALGGRLRHRGTLTFVLPTGSLPEAMAAMTAAGCAPAAVFPLWPRAGQAAKLMLLRGVRGGRMAPRLLAGMALHAADGFTAEAEAVLRRGAAIDLA